MTKIDQWVQEYEERLESYRTAARLVEEEVIELLERERILARCSSRAKSVPSLKRKLIRLHERYGESLWCGSLSETVGDLAAARVCPYADADIERIINIFRTHFEIVEGTIERKSEGRVNLPDSDPARWYDATHMQVRLRIPEERQHMSHLRSVQIEVQICNLLQHVWNEVDHDIRYKPAIEPSDKISDLLVSLGRRLAGCNDVIMGILEEHQRHELSLGTRPLASVQSLKEALSLYRPATIRCDYCDDWDLLYSAISESGVGTYQELWDAIEPSLFQEPNAMMEALNSRKRKLIAWAGRAILRLPDLRFLLLSPDNVAHRVAVSLLPQLADRFSNSTHFPIRDLASRFLSLGKVDIVNQV